MSGGSDGGSDTGRDPPTVAELGRAVEGLLDLHTALREQVEDLATADRPTGPPVFRWAELDAAAAADAWAALGAWVGWLLDRHLVKEVPRGCWWRHGMLVEELSALWWAWQAAYAKKADPTAPLLWLEHLDRARERFRLRMTQQGSCMTSGHQEGAAVAAAADGLADFPAFVADDLSRRQETATAECDAEPESAPGDAGV